MNPYRFDMHRDPAQGLLAQRIKGKVLAVDMSIRPSDI